MEDILGSATHIITLKPAFAKTVLPIPAVKGCFALRVNLLDMEKKKDVSVRPASFSGNSGLRGNTSA